MLTSQRLSKVFVGHHASEYSKPRLAWDISEDYFYCTSEGEHIIYLFSVFTGNIKESLRGHSGIVKDISLATDSRMIVSASFDHSVIIWGRK